MVESHSTVLNIIILIVSQILHEFISISPIPRPTCQDSVNIVNIVP